MVGWSDAVVRLWKGNTRGERSFLGTGFFISDTYLLTCRHVIQEAENHPIFFFGSDQEGNQKIENIIDVRGRDIAVLRLSAPYRSGKRIPLGNDTLRSEMDTTIYGYDTPNEAVAILSRRVRSRAGEVDAYVLDGVVGTGMSGSPVMGPSGLLGIVYARHGDSNKTYVIPVDAFRDHLPSLPDASPPLSTPAVTAVFEESTYLKCDRMDQWSALEAAINRPQHLLFCIPGPEGEAHEKFNKRVYNFLLNDPRHRMVVIHWPWRERPPRNERDYLSTLAQSLDCTENALGAELEETLTHRNVVALHPCIGERLSTLETDALKRYYVEWLPGVLARVSHLPFKLKCIQPVAWSLFGHFLRERIRTIFFPKTADRPLLRKSTVRKWMKGLRIPALKPEHLSLVALPDLDRIERSDIVMLLDALGIEGINRSDMLSKVLVGKSSQDIFNRLKDELAKMNG